MNPEKNLTAPAPTDRDIFSTRVFTAPRDLVWRAWTEPQHLARWWGPKGFTNTFREFDPRPGGHWRFTMHGPDGTDYDNHSVFVELEAPARLVLDHLSNPKFRVTATFADEAGGTRVGFLMHFESAAVCAAVRPICEPSNEENFDRLEAELARMRAAPAAAPAPRHELVLTRHIKAPRAKLFRCWTEPALMKQWFAPLPYIVTAAETDLRPGGASLVVMRGPDGGEIPCPGVYLEVVPDARIVFTDAYTKAWVPSAKPFMTAIITFEDEAGGTRYTARALHWTAEDKATHEKMGFHQGWGLCADQLAALAARL